MRRRTEEAGLSNYVFGKVPPQARDMEEAILGAMMLEKDAVAPMLQMLTEEAFYVEAHQLVFRAIKNLFVHKEPVDLLTVTEELRRIEMLERVGGAFAVTDLTNRVTSAANVEHHARIVLGKYVKRQLIVISSKVIERAYDDFEDELELLEYSSSETKDIYNILDTQKSKDFPSMVMETYNSIVESGKEHRLITGKPIGHTLLDDMANGRPQGELIILAARPGMGKTSWVNDEILRATIDNNEKVAVFSLETAYKRWLINTFSNRMRVNNRKMVKGDVDLDKLKATRDELMKLGIFLYDSSNVHIYDLQARVHVLKKKYDITRVYIDYLQLMKGEKERNGNREQELSTISRALKGITLDEDIPVIAISQLNRSVETRGGDMRPKLSDLRESGAIEQDADQVHFLYRPDYYKKEVVDKFSGMNMDGKIEYIIAKNRNGQLGKTFYEFTPEYGHFVEINLNNTMAPVPSTVFNPSNTNSLTDDDTPF